MVSYGFFPDAVIYPSTNSIFLNQSYAYNASLSNDTDTPPQTRDNNNPRQDINSSSESKMIETFTVCKHCGATNRLYIGQTVPCEYCGTPIKGE